MQQPMAPVMDSHAPPHFGEEGRHASASIWSAPYQHLAAWSGLPAVMGTQPPMAENTNGYGAQSAHVAQYPEYKSTMGTFGANTPNGPPLGASALAHHQQASTHPNAVQSWQSAMGMGGTPQAGFTRDTSGSSSSASTEKTWNIDGGSQQHADSAFNQPDGAFKSNTDELHQLANAAMQQKADGVFQQPVM
eukprot:6212068-Pleurochrysis_carterae.AAC.1